MNQNPDHYIDHASNLRNPAPRISNAIPLRVLVGVRQAMLAMPSLYGIEQIPVEKSDALYKAIGAFSYYVDELVRQAGDVAVNEAA